MAFFGLGCFAFGFILANWIVHRLYGINENPYISAHRLIHKNDKDYANYLKWLGDKGGVPLSKLEAKNEIQANRKIKDLLK